MIEFIEGLIMLIVPLSIVCIFIIKWRKDYKQTGKLFVLEKMGSTLFFSKIN